MLSFSVMYAVMLGSAPLIYLEQTRTILTSTSNYTRAPTMRYTRASKTNKRNANRTVNSVEMPVVLNGRSVE